MSKKKVLGLPFDNLTFCEARDCAVSRMLAHEKTVIYTPNAEIAYEALKNDKFAELLKSADMLVPDGAGVVLASKLAGTPLTEKVAGFELGEALVAYAAKNGNRIFFFGGAKDAGNQKSVAEAAGEKLGEKYPGFTPCGTRNGYFKPDDSPEIIKEINAASPDIVFVCLGSPKQEEWIFEHKDELSASLLLGLGGSLDGYAGIVKRAPKLFIRLRLEWFYRLCRQPKRFMRMTRIPRYLFRALCAGLKKKEN